MQSIELRVYTDCSEDSLRASDLATPVNKSRSAKYELGILLLLLTAAALLAHGYHPYAEDAEIYLPGIELILNHHLFPVGREFFQSHASMTLFPNLVAW